MDEVKRYSVHIGNKVYDVELSVSEFKEYLDTGGIAKVILIEELEINSSIGYGKHKKYLNLRNIDLLIEIIN